MPKTNASWIFIASWVPTIMGKMEGEKVEAMKKTIVTVEILEGALKDTSKGKPFFGGDTIGLMDVMLGALNSWMKATEVLTGVKILDPTKTPLLAAWAERFNELDSAKEVLPDIDGVVEYAKMRQAEAAAVASKKLIEMARGDELMLLGKWPSPFVTRVELALGLKGLSYEYVKQDLVNKSELLLTSNPVHKKIPVLIHNGKPICESSIIVQYIDEAFPDAGAALLPADPYERAVARFWVAYIDDKFVSAWVATFRGKTEEEKTEGMKQLLAVVETLEGALKDCSKGKPFFGGDIVGIVDVALGGLISWVKATEVLAASKIFDKEKAPLLAAWAKRFSELDVAEKVLPDVDGVVEFAKMRLAEAAAASKN
uniref:glutathione transferase n=1 Tax=Oryza punctata TaxID=4537 RepID=A0A0E0MA09_ORYPU